MFSKKQESSSLNIDVEQHELLENAQARIRQKKRLYYHFIFFLLASVLLIVANNFFDYGEEYDWYIWIIFVWLFFLMFHLINVFITYRFMGKKWERQQREKLVIKQKAKIAVLQQKIENEMPYQPDTPETP